MMKFGITFMLALTLSLASWAQNTPPPVTTPAPAEPKPAALEPATPAPAAPATAEPAPAKKKAAKSTAKKKKAVAPKETAEKKTEKKEEPSSFAPIGTATVKQDAVNVRGRPAFLGEVVAKLKKGDAVTLLEEITLKQPKEDEPKDWYRIALPAKTPVWAFADYLDLDGKKVKANRINLRSGPGENYSILGRMEKGDPINVLSTKNDWVELEAPAQCYAFVAAQFLDKQAAVPAATVAKAPEPAPAPAPAPEVTTLPPVETPKAAEPTPAEAPKPAEEPAPAPAPAPVVSAPVITTPEAAPAVVPKRIVKREGIVRHVSSIQAPTYFQLEAVGTGDLMNYLHSPEEVTERIDPKKKKKIVERKPKFNLEPFFGKRVIVTGEEFMDKRWTKTPVIEIESVEPAP